MIHIIVMIDEYSDTVIRIRRKSWKLTLMRTIAVWMIMGWLMITTAGAIILLVQLWPIINGVMTNLNTLTSQGQYFLGDLTNLTHRVGQIAENFNELIDHTSGQMQILPQQLQSQLLDPLMGFINDAQDLIQRINQLLTLISSWNVDRVQPRFRDPP